jgi:hypothetical protein
MKRIIFILLTSATILSSCASQAGIKPVSTITPQPALTATLFPPTLAARFIDLKSGGFSLAVQPELEFETDDYSINLSDKGGELIVSLNGKPYIASIYTLESFLDKYLVEMAARGGSFNRSEPYAVTIDGMSGIAIDLTGNFLEAPTAGKAVAISPGKDFIFFGLGMSNLNTHKNGWAESGSVIFEALIASIKFKDEVKR